MKKVCVFGESDCVYLFLFISEESFFRRTGVIRACILSCAVGLVVFSLLYSTSGKPLRGHSPSVRVLQLGFLRDPEEFPGRVKLSWLSSPFPRCWTFSPRLYWITGRVKSKRINNRMFCCSKALEEWKSFTMLLYNGEKVTNIALCSQACYAIHWPLAAVMLGVRVVGGALGSG